MESIIQLIKKLFVARRPSKVVCDRIGKYIEEGLKISPL